MRILSVFFVLVICVSPALGLEADDPALVGVWLFDEGEGDEVADIINGNDGFLNLEDDFEWEPAGGQFGGAIGAFGGGSIDVDDSDSLATIEDAVTVSAWFRVDADSATGVRKQGAFLLEDQSGSEPIPDGFSFRVWTSEGITPGFYGSTELEQGEWYHVVGTYDSETETTEMYINGVPESEAGDVFRDNGDVWDPTSHGGTIGAGSPLQLKYGPEPYTGAIDEVVILNRAITQEEVVQLMGGWDSIVTGGNPCDVNGDGNVDAADIDATAAAARAAGENPGAAVAALVTGEDCFHTWIGDANLDGEFNSSDFVAVFQEGLFETGGAATWVQGDWNGDGVFNSSDFVAAFQDGGFELGPRWAEGVAAVPEPSSVILLLLGTIGLIKVRRRT